MEYCEGRSKPPMQQLGLLIEETRGELVFIGAALSSEVIGPREDDQGDARIYFGPVPLGAIDSVTLKLGPVAS